MKSTWAVALGAALLSGAALADETLDLPGDKAESNMVHSREEDQCRVVGSTFYRLAQERKAGADERTATGIVEEWLSGLSRTGSHTSKDYRASVADAARLVFRLKQLNSISLGAFGRASCLMEFAYDKDEQKRTAGTVELLQATADCQNKNPGDTANGALSSCVREVERKIQDQLRTARVEIRK